MKKQYRVYMDGAAHVWADDEDDAREQIREQFNLWHYAEETGETMADEDDEIQALSAGGVKDE